MKKKNIIIISVVVAFLLVYFITKSIVVHKVRSSIDNVIEEASQFAKIDYDDIDVSLISWNAHIKGISIKSVGSDDVILKIKKVIVYDYDRGSKSPNYANFYIKDMSFDNIPGFLEELGYNRLVVDMSLDWDYNNKKGIYRLKKLSINANDIGELNLKFTLTNLNLEDEYIDMAPDDIIFMFQKALIENAEISYKDDSLIKKTIEHDAEQQGLSYKSMRDKIVNDINVDNFPGIPGKDLKKIKKFIKEQGTISVSISPESSLNLKQLSEVMDMNKNSNAFKQIYKKLNVKISI